ncbi:MAG TPA: carbohydrate kinase [Fontimonas sp.]
MARDNIVVLDIGKTVSKLSVWDARGHCIAQRTRPNRGGDGRTHDTLDVDGIDQWLSDALAEFASLARIDAIVPVGHGAAAAIVRDGQLACAVTDYEQPVPADLRDEYAAQRDAFVDSGSPQLPNGLNLGTQLHHLEATNPGVLAGTAQIVPWPQFWAWKLCGVAASEVSSLGCHSDLWRPLENRPSALAHRRGWAARLAPLRGAHEVLGTLNAEWAARTGLPRDVKVVCGLHDSNAALHATRGVAGFASGDATVVSTGTWFVAMRTPSAGATLDLSRMAEDRDCLINVNVEGRPIPSARFMGGRELMLLGGGVDLAMAPTSPGALQGVVNAGTMILPGQVEGVGPFPRARGRRIGNPGTPDAQVACVALYCALMTNVMLELIGSRERVLIEGRFAEFELYVSALATLRPDLEIYAGAAAEGVALGALRLLDPSLQPAMAPTRVSSLNIDLHAYHAHWRHLAETSSS